MAKSPSKLDQRIWPSLQRHYKLLLLGLMLLSFVTRVWALYTLPPGLNQDEASIGYEAFSILNFGLDRNGLPYPVFLISWGSGQNALYAYLIMPFISALGLSSFSVRLPMALMGTITVAATAAYVQAIGGWRAGIASVLFLALSPWHIMMSRWGLEANALPFAFSLSLACLSRVLDKSTRHAQIWQIATGALFGACMYAYGTAYFTVPVFLIVTVGICAFFKKLPLSGAVIIVSLFILVSSPILITILIGILHLPTLHLGPLSLPAMISNPRFMALIAPGGRIRPELLLQNTKDFMRLIWTQHDAAPFSATPPHGYIYTKFFFLVACAGILIVIINCIRKREALFGVSLITWSAVCLIQGCLVEPNITRNNLLWPALTIAAGIGASAISKKWVALFILILCAYVGHFGMFANDYATRQYDALRRDFADGFLPALRSARQYAGDRGGICVTSNLNMPYIYALFEEQTDPRVFASTVKYENPGSSFQKVYAFGRYIFGLNQCKTENTQAVVGLSQELPPEFARAWPSKQVYRFTVWMRPAS